jgi:outer membrane protein assembly factor BamA
LRLRSAFLEAFFGNVLSNVMVSGLGVRGEFDHLSPIVAPRDFTATDDKFFSFFGLIWIDTLNRAVFPSRGHSAFFKSEIGYNRLGGAAQFVQHTFDWQGFFALHARASLLARLQLGSADKAGLPLHYQFYLGGVDSFVGLRPQELAGKNVQALQVGLQYEFLPHRFLLLRWNLGNTFETWQLRINRRRFVTGAGLTFGAPTLIGPVEFTVMSGSRHDFLANLNVGYKF